MIEQAIELIRKEVTEKSIVCSSFGKDSMVLLELVKQAGLKLPILFLKEAHFPEKYAFANTVILAEGYTVYDLPPMNTSYTKVGENFEVWNSYYVGPDAHMSLPCGVVPPDFSKPYLCGRDDLLGRPLGVSQFPWDTLFIGHKASDVDPMYGPIPIKDSVRFDKGLKFVYPLIDFTDKDIWDFTEKFSVPVHRHRYNEQDNYREFPDKSFNPDYLPACMACLDPDSEEPVYCPKLQKYIKKSLDRFETVTLPPYIGVK